MDDEHLEPPAPGGRVPRKVDRRVLAVLVAVLVVVAIVVVIVLVVGGGDDDGTSEAEMRSRLVGAVAEAQETARTAEGAALDLVALRAELEDVAQGWLVDLDATEDRRLVGVAARRLDAPVCIFVWSAVGGPRSAVVNDPNLPCEGEIARIAGG
jgi:hypothetical protein